MTERKTIYRCRRCYSNKIKEGLDAEEARSKAEFTLNNTPKVAVVVACRRCKCVDVEVVKF